MHMVDHALLASDDDLDSGVLPTDRDFTIMRAIYRTNGGIVRGDVLARLLADRPSTKFVSLARLVSFSDVFGFESRGVFWVPMFQFDLRDMSVKRNPRMVVAELAFEFDDWTIALWFAQANHWLGGMRPIDLLEWNLPEVLKAARADRIVAAG